MFEYYGTMEEANTYFSHRLHEEAWSIASVEDRRRALIKATQIIDSLNFKGEKHTVYLVITTEEGTRRVVSDEVIREADLAQELEFPRGKDTEVPKAIKVATWEIAHALLDGIDPDLELENLAVVSQGIASVRTAYNRDMSQIEHLVNGVPSAAAWRYLRPFLRDADAVRLRRAD